MRPNVAIQWRANMISAQQKDMDSPNAAIGLLALNL